MTLQEERAQVLYCYAKLRFAGWRTREGFGGPYTTARELARLRNRWRLIRSRLRLRACPAS
jgi:hypothetical protein